MHDADARRVPCLLCTHTLAVRENASILLFYAATTMGASAAAHATVQWLRLQLLLMLQRRYATVRPMA